jgi:hypothetical protein
MQNILKIIQVLEQSADSKFNAGFNLALIMSMNRIIKKILQICDI